MCISYIESELLSESAAVRNEAIGERDFRVADPTPPSSDGVGNAAQEPDAAPAPPPAAPEKVEDEEEEEEEEYGGPALAPEMLDEVRRTHPLEQLATVKELLGDACSVERLRPADYKELALIQGLALAQLGSPKEALVHWEACLAYNTKYCPPHDEGTVCYAVQAALCALEAGAHLAAVDHMLVAMDVHAVAFGPGLPLFQARYATELASAPPPLKDAAATLADMLAVDAAAMSRETLVASWHRRVGGAP